MDLSVDRLTLRLAGLTEAEGRQVGRLVVEHLVLAPAPGGSLTTDRIHVSLTPQPGESLDSMANRIAGRVAYALARSS